MDADAERLPCKVSNRRETFATHVQNLRGGSSLECWVLLLSAECLPMSYCSNFFPCFALSSSALFREAYVVDTASICDCLAPGAGFGLQGMDMRIIQ